MILGYVVMMRSDCPDEPHVLDWWGAPAATLDEARTYVEDDGDLIVAISEVVTP